MSLDEVTVAEPTIDDGAAMWRVARAVGLDLNSAYKYLIFCRDFAATSAVARDEGEVVGFVTGYRRPTAPDTVFVWQVGVLSEARGRGVAAAMLEHVVAGGTDAAGPGANPPRYMEATVTPTNEASSRLFAGLAARHGARLERSVLFTAELFPETHAEEVLLRIGPL